MVVDDEPNIRNGLPYLIDWEKYHFSICSVAKNGNDAIKKLNTTYPDLIITDIKMPGLDGLGLIRYIRKNLNDKKMPFIILSSYNDFKFAKEAIKYNVKSYLLKPVDEGELIELLQEIQQELTRENLFEFFYNKRVEEFNNHFKEVRQFNLLIEAIENNQKKNIEKTINDIFSYFEKEKFHPNLIKIHLDNFFINISNIITELGGSIDNLNNKDSLMEVHISNLNVIQLKNRLQEFSLNCARYINELKTTCGIINKVKQYIKSNYYKNLRLKDIAEVFYINPAYLGQLFKKETGMNFSQYLNEIRLQNAKKLLMRTNLHVYQIAERVGYKNADYFIIKFKEAENCTPMEYKNRLVK